MNETSRPLAVSAPGKVLLAGGYLVLDRRYTGLVFGLDARIHVLVQTTSHQPSVPSHARSGTEYPLSIVRSPQFTDARWRYGYQLLERGGGVKVEDLKDSRFPYQTENKFLETALGYALSYVSAKTTSNPEPVIITILADSDYYSQEAKPTGDLRTPAAQSRFVDFGVRLQDANKTGLGSSAALVTAFVAAILSYYLSHEVFDLSTDDGKAKVHNLAQAAHSDAQGKIGSGFDVAAAVYGSCLYKRFSPSILGNLGKPGSPNFAGRLESLVDDTDKSCKWDTLIAKGAVKLPRKIRVVLCDVDCGTQTVGMVKKVLAWRQENPEEADDIWNSLQRENDELINLLTHLTNMQASKTEEFKKDLDIIIHGSDIQSPDEIWEGYYNRIRGTFSAIRALILQMSTKAAVPIEPPSQTELLNACSMVPGILGGVVPGAGGYDAIALLVIDDDVVLSRLGAMLRKWGEARTNEVNDGNPVRVRMLGVREEMAGVRMEEEEEEEYGNWLR